MFCTFSLPNRLRATTACNFLFLISPDVSAPAALASLLFNSPESQNHEKNQCFTIFLPFRAPAFSFFWFFLFRFFSLLTAFLSLHIVGNLISKFPSIIMFLGWFFRFYFRCFCLYIFTGIYIYIYILYYYYYFISINIYLYIYIIIYF